MKFKSVIKRLSVKKVALYYATNPAEPMDVDLVGWTGPGWYFWAETGAHMCGPFDTEQECIQKYKEYRP